MASSAFLKSKLFAGDQRLAGALVEDAKHITKGDSGSHVSKIQSAVLMLEGGIISGAEISGRIYGETTAKAVLAYKTRRGIINRSYQQKADDIVGKMTMSSLDHEVFLVELQDRVAGVKS